jgi:hypothetical protein
MFISIVEVFHEKKTQELGTSSSYEAWSFKFYKILKLQGLISAVAMVDCQSQSSKMKTMLNFFQLEHQAWRWQAQW